MVPVCVSQLVIAAGSQMSSEAAVCRVRGSQMSSEAAVCRVRGSQMSSDAADAVCIRGC